MYQELSKHLDLLGMRVVDRVTEVEGVVTSVAFDLFGCIQALVQYRKDNDINSWWMDVSRLRILDAPRSMVPVFMSNRVAAEGNKGPADKPKPLM